MSDAPRRGRPPRYREPVYQAQEEGEYDSLNNDVVLPEIELATPAGWRDAEPEATPPATPDGASWEPISDETPRDGLEVLIAYREYDDGGNLTRDDTRTVRWKQGRYFTGRRWQEGGAWVPTDGMTPLPATSPTHWLKPAAPPDSESEQAA